MGYIMTAQHSTAQHSTAQHSTAQHSTAQHSIQIREAALSDLEILFEWRNDPITRSFSHNTDPVQIGGHRQWLESTLSNPTRKLYIAETKGQPIGTIRVDYDNDGAELSWTVAPLARGMGLGKCMVQQVADMQSCCIRAEVKAGNFASEKIALYSGMKLVKNVEGILHFKREI